MAYDISRRLLLSGATGLSIAGATACASSPAKLAVASSEAAFPPEKVAVENPYLLGPPEGVALLSRNENPYGPAPSALKMIEYAGTKGAYYASQDAVKLGDAGLLQQDAAQLEILLVAVDHQRLAQAGHSKDSSSTSNTSIPAGRPGCPW